MSKVKGTDRSNTTVKKVLTTKVCGNASKYNNELLEIEADLKSREKMERRKGKSIKRKVRLKLESCRLKKTTVQWERSVTAAA